MYGNDHADQHNHAKELAMLLLTTMLLQPPYAPSSEILPPSGEMQQ